jgi:uncharacterized DUF497 family protein
MGSEKGQRESSNHNGVSFEEGMTVFADPLAKIFNDEEHSYDEQREIIIWTFNETASGSGFVYSRRSQSSDNQCS